MGSCKYLWLAHSARGTSRDSALISIDGIDHKIQEAPEELTATSYLT